MLLLHRVQIYFVNILRIESYKKLIIISATVSLFLVRDIIHLIDILEAFFFRFWAASGLTWVAGGNFVIVQNCSKNGDISLSIWLYSIARIFNPRLIWSHSFGQLLILNFYLIFEMIVFQGAILLEETLLNNFNLLLSCVSVFVFDLWVIWGKRHKFTYIRHI